LHAALCDQLVTVGRLASVKRHPELRHEEELWFAFTERIVRGMGGDSDAAREMAIAMTRAWERSENFDLYDDVRPVLADLRARGLKLGLVSNGGREISDFVAHHRLDVDCAIASRGHGWVKPHEFVELKDEAEQIGFSGVMSGPLVRSSYRAGRL